jgi:hypothetical protein
MRDRRSSLYNSSREYSRPEGLPRIRVYPDIILGATRASSVENTGKEGVPVFHRGHDLIPAEKHMMAKEAPVSGPTPGMPVAAAAAAPAPQPHHRPASPSCAATQPGVCVPFTAGSVTMLRT